MLDSILDETFDVEKKVFSKMMSRELMENLDKYLTEKEYFIICSRFGLNSYSLRTLESIEMYFGVTRERIRQVEKKGYKKIERKCSQMKSYLV